MFCHFPINFGKHCGNFRKKFYDILESFYKSFGDTLIKFYESSKKILKKSLVQEVRQKSDISERKSKG